MRFWLAGPRIVGIRPGISFALSELSRSRPSPRQRQLRQLQGSFIYIVQADDGLIKVGISGNPSRRLGQLQAASAAHLKLAYVGAVPGNGFAVEAATHKILAAHRRTGEWFDVPPEMAVAAVATAAYRLNEPLASGDPGMAAVAVRMAARADDARDPLGWLGSALLAAVKGLLAIPLILMIMFSGYILLVMIRNAI